MLAVGLTDLDWFAYLRDGPALEEVNFWTPTPWGIRNLHSGDLWYFLLKSPVRKVGGWGTFASYEEMGTTAAWDRFGPGNGVPDLVTLAAKTGGYATKHAVSDAGEEDRTIGCIVLRNPVLLEDAQMRTPDQLGAPVPNPVVKYKTFPSLDRLDFFDMSRVPSQPFYLVEPGGRARRTMERVDRPGQRAFRDCVLRAYGFACAITGETCRQVLEAAHIQPYVDERSDDVRNGIALRSDLNALFDTGLITVGDDLLLRVSAQLSSPAYQLLEGNQFRIPASAENHPAHVALAFHREMVFRN